MKQLYYGNDLFGAGYTVIAKSEGIPQSAVQLMEKCATIFGAAPVDECGVISSSEGTVFFNNTSVAPRVEYGENRPTVLSHQYFIEKGEQESFFENFTYVLNNSKFEKNYGAFDVSDKMITPGFSMGVEEIEDRVVFAAKVVIKKNKRMIIHAEEMDKDAALKIIGMIAQKLSVEERAKISFVSGYEPGKNKLVQNMNFIFCKTRDFAEISGSLGNVEAYYDVSDNSVKIISEQPRTDVIKPVVVEEQIDDKRKKGRSKQKKSYTIEEGNTIDVNYKSSGEKQHKDFVVYVVLGVVLVALLLSVVNNIKLRGKIRELQKTTEENTFESTVIEESPDVEKPKYNYEMQQDDPTEGVMEDIDEESLGYYSEEFRADAGIIRMQCGECKPLIVHCEFEHEKIRSNMSEIGIVRMIKNNDENFEEVYNLFGIKPGNCVITFYNDFDPSKSFRVLVIVE